MDALARLTPATIDVLRILAGDAGPHWGLRVIRDSGRPPGSVYPILDRLERARWVDSEWETDTDRSGPRRRYYRLTAEGADAAVSAIASFESRAARRSPVRELPA